MIINLGYNLNGTGIFKHIPVSDQWSLGGGGAWAPVCEKVSKVFLMQVKLRILEFKSLSNINERKCCLGSLWPGDQLLILHTLKPLTTLYLLSPLPLHENRHSLCWTHYSAKSVFAWHISVRAWLPAWLQSPFQIYFKLAFLNISLSHLKNHCSEVYLENVFTF